MDEQESQTQELDSRSRKTPFIHKMDKSMAGIVCPSYYVLSHANGCPYRCDYCCLQLPLKNIHTPVAFENRMQMLAEVERFLSRGRAQLLSAGESSDSLALDPLTGLASELVPLFARQDDGLLFPKERPHKLLLVTKSTNIAGLLSMKEKKNTIVSFSLNAPEISARFEHGAPHPYERLAAAVACKSAGYEVRLRVDPIVPVKEWREWYRPLTERMKSAFDGYPLRVTLGTIRHNPGLRECAGDRGRNASVFDYATSQDGSDGRYRVPQDRRVAVYAWFRDVLGPAVNIALCKETVDVWEQVGLLRGNPGCNCAL